MHTFASLVLFPVKWFRVRGVTSAARSQRGSMAALAAVVVWCCLPALAGCGTDYYLQLLVGELASLANTIPVADALGDTDLTDDELAKLALTQQVRQFGIDRIGLYAGDAYTVFEANGSEPAAYVLSASAKESLTPYRWDFLVMGPMETKGFFDQGMAQREADCLAEADYDVYLARADGFSTLGFLPDPVRQSNLALDEIDLAELILHEMTHSTVFKSSDLDFSESLATFIGRAAAQEWFNQTFGDESTEAKAARVRFADKVVIDEFVNDLFAEVTRYYLDAATGGEQREVVIAGRQPVFDAGIARFSTIYQPRLQDPDRWTYVGELELDNALLLAAIRYQDSLSDYQAVLDKAGGSFPDALVVFRQAVESPDGREFLREWVWQP